MYTVKSSLPPRYTPIADVHIHCGLLTAEAVLEARVLAAQGAGRTETVTIVNENGGYIKQRQVWFPVTPPKLAA